MEGKEGASDTREACPLNTTARCPLDCRWGRASSWVTVSPGLLLSFSFPSNKDPAPAHRGDQRLIRELNSFLEITSNPSTCFYGQGNRGLETGKNLPKALQAWA